MARHLTTRQLLRWGTLGKHPTSNTTYKWVAIKDLSDNHIQAILRTQFHIGRWLRDILHEEII